MSELRPSHLELERLALDELAPSDRARVRRFITDDPVVARAYREIAEARAVALHPLRQPSREPKRRGGRPFGWVWLVPAVAAAGVLVAVGLQSTGPGRDLERRTKGAPAHAVVTVIAERDGRLRTAPSTITPDDRLRLLVTCAFERSTLYDVAVIEGTTTSFPLPRGTLACGNRQPLPGAFRIDARGPVRVCLVTGPELPDRRALAHRPPEGPSCVDLDVRPAASER